MKIRIKGNTVRYRLSKPEVTELGNSGRLEEQTDFLTNTLVYAIQQSKKEELSADFSQNTITLYIPQTALQQWVNTEQVGIEINMPIKNGKTLSTKSLNLVILNSTASRYL